MTTPLTIAEMLQLAEKSPDAGLQPDASYEDVFASEVHDRLV
jgi:hypothetical protein